MVITGPTGSGKSYSALTIAKMIDPDFTAENICFKTREFMQLINGRVKKLKKGSVILWDEMQVEMASADFQSLQAKSINYILQTFRHRNFILICTTPHFHFLNAGTRKLFHCRAETVKKDMQKKRIHLKPFLLQTDQERGKIYRKYLRIITKENGIIPHKNMKVAPPPKELVAEYEEKKSKFTKKLNEEIEAKLDELEGVKNRELTEQQKQVARLMMQGYGIQDICSHMGIHRSGVYAHINLAKKKGLRIVRDRKSKEKTVYIVENPEEYNITI